MNRFKDPLKDIQSMMDLAYGPLKRYQEMEKLVSIANPLKHLFDTSTVLSDPLKEHRELIAKSINPLGNALASQLLIPDPLREHRELLTTISNPLMDLHPTLTSISEIFNTHNEYLKSTTKPLSDLWMNSTSGVDLLEAHRNKFSGILDPFSDMAMSMKMISEPMKKLTESYGVNSRALSKLLNTINENTPLNSLKDIALEVGAHARIDSDGIISYSSKQIKVSELEELTKEVFLEASKAQSETFQQSIDRLVDAINSQKDPVTQKILVFFVIPFIFMMLASVINPLMDEYVKSHLKSEKRTLIKELKSQVNSSIPDKNILSDYRYVSADVLNVRSSPSIKSNTIGSLHFSASVYIIEKRKDWSLVNWKDPNSEVQITGWVFTRYLSKFR
jgi:hypothetical protein